ncbi:MAG TPA: 50S ribosomal protein L35 [Gaiellaceae bacterium]|nr:50S ribosomal protein L35 [Gaiellaceae bacterium]
MPKMKTGKGAKKRFKVTGTGKLRRRRPKMGLQSHNLEKKSSKRRRSLRKMDDVAKSDVKRVKKLLRGG